MSPISATLPEFSKGLGSLDRIRSLRVLRPILVRFAVLELSVRVGGIRHEQIAEM
jgi:hypothetical protein